MSKILAFLKMVLGIVDKVETAAAPTVNLLGPVLAAFGGPVPAAAVTIFTAVQNATHWAEELLGEGTGVDKMGVVTTVGGAMLMAAVKNNKLTQAQADAVKNLLPTAAETVLTAAQAVQSALTPAVPTPTAATK
jgi:hypothetical protein